MKETIGITSLVWELCSIVFGINDVKYILNECD